MQVISVKVKGGQQHHRSHHSGFWQSISFPGKSRLEVNRRAKAAWTTGGEDGAKGYWYCLWWCWWWCCPWPGSFVRSGNSVSCVGDVGYSDLRVWLAWGEGAGGSVRWRGASSYKNSCISAIDVLLTLTPRCIHYLLLSYMYWLVLLPVYLRYSAFLEDFYFSM